MGKKIALWSHPRSMSTSLERYFRERGDCQCHHEPFMYYYYLVRQSRLYPDFRPEAERPRQFQDITAMLTQPTDSHANIFFKDMSYYVDDCFSKMAEFAEATTPVFLIRDPRFSIASYYRLDPGFSLHETGLEAQFNHYQWLESRGIRPLVIEAETILRSPEVSLKAICQYAEIPFIAEAMHWDSQSVPTDWDQVAAWHTSSMKSTGFAKPSERDPDEVFSKVVQQAGHLQGYLDCHQPFYEALKERAWIPHSEV